MREFDLEGLVNTDTTLKVLVDSKEACLHEAGELQFLQNTSLDDIVEIGDLVDAAGNSKAVDRSSYGRVTAYKVSSVCFDFLSISEAILQSVGVGSMDVSITMLVLKAAEEHDLGQMAEL